MADEVEISNVGGDGVASEITLLALVAAMEKMGGGKGKGGAATKVQELHNRSITAGTSTTNKNTAATANASVATAKAAEATGKFARTIAGATSVALGKLVGSVTGLTSELLGGAEDISSFAQHLPLIGGYLGSLTGIIDENINSFRSLSQVGATFGDGLNDIRATAARAGIPLGEFTQLVSQNAERMKFFGATTASGATAFATMSKELRNGPGRRLMSLGFTAQELNESLIDYAEFSQRQVTREGQQNRMSAAGAASYLETIDSLAAVTGKRRDQIKAEMNAALGDQRNRLAMAAMTKDEGERFLGNLAQTPDALKDAMTDMADGIANTPLAQGMMVASDTFRDQAANIKNLDATAYNNFLVKVREEIDAKGTALGLAAQALINSGSAIGEAFSVTASLADKIHINENQALKNVENRLKETTKDKSLKGFSDAVRNIRTGLMDAFVTSGVLKTIQDAFNDLAKIIGTPEFAAGLKAGVEMLLDGVKLAAGAIKSVFTFLSSIGDTFGTAGVIAAVVAGIGALFAAKAVVGALTSKVGGAMGLGKTSSGNTRNAGKGAGNVLGNIGGGVLKGLAGGISAFANPTVALGAAGLAAAIVLIGGAIAGATWMMGASLPKMSEGLKGFEALDGAKLIDAGKGMGAIALGMAAFGAGSAVAGLGNLVGNVTEGIVGFFGGDDPLTKIQKFQDYNFNKEKIEANSASIVAYGTAMSALGSAGALTGIGSAVSAVGSGIAALFGGDDPLTGLIKFQSYNLDVAKIQANANAIKAYAFAMKDFPESPSVSLFDSFKNGLIGFFGGNTDPFASIVKFGEMKFNTAGILANSGAVKSFGDAMSGLSALSSVGDIELPKNLASNLDVLNKGLDASGIITYTKAIAGLSGLVGGFAEGISKFFGADDPLTKLQKFGDMKINIAGVTANSAAINAMSSSLSNFSLEKLDASGIITYTKAMEDLVEVLGVGSAIAGATWMVGAALPTMAEGMKSFEELNGSKLVDAGLGMLSVAAGLAAIGAGGVAGAVGGAASGLIDGISGFFGAESPLDKMLAFQKYDFDADKIENNSRAMVAYSQGMALMGGAGVVSGIGSAIGAFGGAIAGLFGADSPLDKISLFQAYNFDPTKIANNASAIEAYSKGMAALGSAEAVGGVGSILGAIGGWFSGNNDMPWESVKAFGDADLSLAGITANAAAVNAMSSSLSNFSLEKLDASGIITYTKAMEDLVEVLGDLNEQLSKDNNGMFSAGTGANAGSVMSSMQSVSGGSSSNDQLNSIMGQVLLVLNQMRDLDDKVEKNTRNIIGSNLAQGGVSKVGR